VGVLHGSVGRWVDVKMCGWMCGKCVVCVDVWVDVSVVGWT